MENIWWRTRYIISIRYYSFNTTNSRSCIRWSTWSLISKPTFTTNTSYSEVTIVDIWECSNTSYPNSTIHNKPMSCWSIYSYCWSWSWTITCNNLTNWNIINNNRSSNLKLRQLRLHVSINWEVSYSSTRIITKGSLNLVEIHLKIGSGSWSTNTYTIYTISILKYC